MPLLKLLRASKESGGETIARTTYFTPDFLRFLSELATHNDRAWFRRNKGRYERSVRDPVLRLIADLQPRLDRISSHFVADPRPVGGSMMRIYRDTRFSKDKTPLKTAVMAHFGHSKGKEGGTPAFYLRLQPGNSVAGGGIWRPEPGALKHIRTAIVEHPRTWQRIKEERVLGSGCTMAGESLKRAPAGFDAGHPLVEDIKRKDFAVSMPLQDRRIVSPAFLDDVVGAFKTTAPFLEFL